jgi:hypothetical protein
MAKFSQTMRPLVKNDHAGGAPVFLSLTISASSGEPLSDHVPNRTKIIPASPGCATSTVGHLAQAPKQGLVLPAARPPTLQGALGQASKPRFFRRPPAAGKRPSACWRKICSQTLRLNRVPFRGRKKQSN